MTGRDGDRERDRDGETEGETEAEGERERERQDIWRVSDRETVTYRDRTEGERETGIRDQESQQLGKNNFFWVQRHQNLESKYNLGKQI